MKKVYLNSKLCLGCRSCEIACAVEHSRSKVLHEAIGEKKRPVKRVKVMGVEGLPLPLQCRHCTDAPCVDACKSGAMHKDEDGATLIDRERCVGCWMCVMVCPYGVIAMDDEHTVALKCDLCSGADERACVAACPTGALFFGELDDFKETMAKREKISAG
jgi:anaerobic carbon-monoxide dehydrogenase iron sulfur subunit